jgi:hypothetical protein
MTVNNSNRGRCDIFTETKCFITISEGVIWQWRAYGVRVGWMHGCDMVDNSIWSQAHSCTHTYYTSELKFFSCRSVVMHHQNHSVQFPSWTHAEKIFCSLCLIWGIFSLHSDCSRPVWRCFRICSAEILLFYAVECWILKKPLKLRQLFVDIRFSDSAVQRSHRFLPHLKLIFILKLTL